MPASQVPAVAAAVQAEVARVAARLAAAFDQTLRRLAEGMAAAGGGWRRTLGLLVTSRQLSSSLLHALAVMNTAAHLPAL